MRTGVRITRRWQNKRPDTVLLIDAGGLFTPDFIQPLGSYGSRGAETWQRWLEQTAFFPARALRQDTRKNDSVSRPAFVYHH